MSESSPMGNVIHMGLTEGSKADPVCEMAEYFIQEREEDINVLSHGDLLCIDIEEHGMLGELLKETGASFRNVVKGGLIMALAYYHNDRTDLTEIDRVRKEWKNNIRLEITIPESIKIHDVSSEEYEGKVITFRTEIASVDERESITLRSQYSCADCSDEFIQEGADEPRICPACEGKKIKFVKVLESESVQRVLIRELLEDTENMTQQIFIGEIHGEYVGNTFMGDRKKLSGVFKSIPLKKKIGQTEAHNMNLIDVFNIQSTEAVKTLLPSPELLERLQNLAKDKKLADLITDSFAYHIYGHETEKLSIILAQIGGTKTETRRGSMHVL